MKIAIVTGAVGGIGYATVEKFNKEGYGVVAMDIAPNEVANEKFANMSNIVYVKGNLASGDDRANLVKVALDTFGRIDALVNVAGVAPKVRNDILEMTEESYDFVMDINLKGTFFLTQLVANQMVQQFKNEGIRGAIAMYHPALLIHHPQAVANTACLRQALLCLLSCLQTDLQSMALL